MEDEYELIPLSPIRRLEKKVEHMEKNATSGEMLGELMDIIKTFENAPSIRNSPNRPSVG